MPDFVLKQWILEPFAGDQAPPHVHTASDEAFCVLSGALEVLLGEERRVLQAGEHVEIPAGTVHTFATVGDGTVTVLAIMTPEVDQLVTALHEAVDDHQRAMAWESCRSRPV